MLYFRNFFLFFFFLCVAQIALASTAQSTKKQPVYKSELYQLKTKSNNGWFVGIGGGTTAVKTANNTLVANGSLTPPPYDQDIYSIGNLTTYMSQLNVGYTWHNRNSFLPSYAAFAQYRHYYNAHINGTVTQYSIPDFENYNYRMDYNADLYTINGKFDLFEYKKFSPYVAVGLGLMVNHVNSYNESALANVTARNSPGYNGNTNVNLAATLGAGFDFILSNNYLLSLGYDHVFQRTVKSGAGTDSWSPTSLNFGNIKLDTVFVNLSANLPQKFWS